MGQNEEILKLFARSEELLETIRRGKQFTEELLRENERLRLRIVQLEKELLDANGEEMARVRGENDQLRRRIEWLERRFGEVEAENKDFVQRYLQVEEQNEGLANLYVASHQLHSTLDLNEVIQIIVEILLNLIGAEEFAIFIMDEEAKELIFAGGEAGARRFPKGRIPLGQGIEGAVAARKEPYRGDGDLMNQGSETLICLPLKLKEHLVGVISIYKLLGQKRGFTALDYELLNLLAGHAATALVSSKLYQGTERKLRTIEGFMNLLRSH
ncbi:MAG: GAF domain-containing protein [Acidobacteriota bacterium]